MKFSIKVTVVFLALIALAHLLRLVFQWEAVFNGAGIPLWMSAVACVVVGGLAFWLWQDNKT